MYTENVSRATDLLEASFRPLLVIATATLPHLIKATAILQRSLKRLPADEARIIIGIIFCFFGGLYPALFAAIQAIKIGGWSTFQGAVNQLSMEVTVILEASKKDDENNKDKKEDEKTYIMRKLNIVLTKLNPEKVRQNRPFHFMDQIFPSLIFPLMITLLYLPFGLRRLMKHLDHFIKYGLP